MMPFEDTARVFVSISISSSAVKDIPEFLLIQRPFFVAT